MCNIMQAVSMKSVEYVMYFAGQLAAVPTGAQ